MSYFNKRYGSEILIGNPTAALVHLISRNTFIKKLTENRCLRMVCTGSILTIFQPTVPIRFDRNGVCG